MPLIPRHWAFQGPQRRRRMRPTVAIFRNVNTHTGRHLATFRRLIAVGPFTVYIGRYRPGNIDNAEPRERIP